MPPTQRSLASTPHLAPQNDQLMSKHRILRLKPALRLERRGQAGQNKPNQRDHCASLADSVTPKIRIRYSVHTAARHAYVAGSRQRAIVALTQNWGNRGFTRHRSVSPEA